LSYLISFVSFKLSYFKDGQITQELLIRSFSVGRRPFGILSYLYALIISYFDLFYFSRYETNWLSWQPGSNTVNTSANKGVSSVVTNASNIFLHLEMIENIFCI